MNIQYDEKPKKILIALLLFASCVISALILVYSPGPSNRSLQSFAQADSLILQTFRTFNIAPDQRRVTVIRVDSNLVRKRYRVNLPPDFQKTTLHAELNRSFNRLSVETPATVTLPEQDLLVQLVYRGTVFRSIDLRTDPGLVMERNYASLMVAFDYVPSRSLLNKVIELGEAVPVVLRVSDAREARELENEIRPSHSRIYYWLTDRADSEPGNKTVETPRNNAFPPLIHLRELQPRVHVLSFKDLSAFRSSSSRSAVKIASDKNITFVDVSSAMILDSNLGERLFKQELEKFEQQAKDGNHPVAIVLGNERALEWLGEKLNDLKRRGLYLTEPPEISF